MDGMKKMGKYISMLLRHHPEEAGLALDAHGWADVQELIEKVQPRYPLTEEALHILAEGPDKKRYEFSEDGTKVRAVHGHSVKVDLGYEEATPPDVLYHGTAERSRAPIERDGIKPMTRQYVHLSEDVGQAKEVGSRHGKLVIYRVDAARMHGDGHVFFRSSSGVWLTGHVPPGYLEEMAPDGGGGMG